ncbi:MAG TPA: glycosyl hydrolase [Polyangiaceae bacterium]|nr:glycosyl hydrolase [Polyangiaceae bacterium]
MIIRRLLPVTLTLVCGGCSSGAKSDAIGAGGAAGATMTGGTAGAAMTGGTAPIAAAGGAGAGGVAPSSGAGGMLATGSGGTPASGGTASGGTAPSMTSGGAAGTSTDGGDGARRPYKGVANSPCAARTALGVSWYYNWEQKETEACSDGSGGEFVPMIWGHTGAEQTAASITTAVQGMATHGYANVLGFNEPDNSSQSNIPVATAIKLWPAFDVKGIALGTPATSANSNGQSWFKDFMTQLTASSTLRADFVGLHWYGWNAGSCDAKASQLESYVKWAEGLPGNHPLWLTEWGCLNDSAPDTKTVVAFYQAAVAMFARHPRVERYAWYPWATNCDLNDKTGALTDLGKAYAAAPAYR